MPQSTMSPEHVTRMAEVPTISAIKLRFFRGIVRGYFRRHFRSVMAQHAERLAESTGPLIIFANHSSWWDPMVCFLFANMLLPVRRHYAPIDAAALARYPILGAIGMFPLDMQSPRGAARFLRTSQAILEAGGVLWLTPQGRFADPRVPLQFKPGLGALVTRMREVTLLPLAIEYSFWDERLPEALLHFGEPLRVNPAATAEQNTTRLEAALRDAMLALQAASVTRNPGNFRVMLTGGRGTGGFYALGRRLRAAFTRTHLSEDHTDRGEP